jgi:hypothetical protein
MADERPTHEAHARESYRRGAIDPDLIRGYQPKPGPARGRGVPPTGGSAIMPPDPRSGGETTTRKA